MALLCLMAGFVLTIERSAAQRINWEFHRVTESGFPKSNPQVMLDRWGISHVMWGSLDPSRAGVQIFYSVDATGRFTTPIQVTDDATGTVFDPSTVPVSAGGYDTLAINPFIFRLDDFGVAHVAYVANKLNHLSLFYKSNLDGNAHRPAEFVRTDSLGEAIRYGMAVDSSGIAHIVWFDRKDASLDLYYWNSQLPGAPPIRILSKLCLPWLNNGCRVGDPDVEIFGNELSIVFRADSGTIYHARKPIGGPVPAWEVIPTPQYDVSMAPGKLADLRIRSALDAAGRLHVIAPMVDRVSGHRIMYFSNSTGAFTMRTLEERLDTIPKGLDLTWSQPGELAAVWTVAPGGTRAPAVRYVGLVPNTLGSWLPKGAPIDLNAVPSMALPNHRTAVFAFARDGRLAVSSQWAIDSLNEQVGLYLRTILEPKVRYILPDAAAPGMNVVVETYAHTRAKGTFGADGFDPTATELELVNASDSTRIILGPSIVSWQGRLISTLIFVKPSAMPGPVPLRVRIGAERSTVDTFMIVTPQHLGGASGTLTTGGALGSGGLLGAKRSRRGVLVVDSLILAQGVYTIDTSDIDPTMPGNQGFLPVTILSKGPVRIGSGTTLSVSAPGHSTGIPATTAGPGGGGGGSAGQLVGGSGYTGGGTGYFLRNGALAESMGTGGTQSGWWNGGPALSGAPGGAMYLIAPSGGGTGHPFGASGAFGRVSVKEPIAKNSGGNGAGAGGAAALNQSDNSWGGGGGGFGTPGGDGDDFGTDSSGGKTVGSSPLVPIAGGSGGGAAASTFRMSNGGGGGGALTLLSFAEMTLEGKIQANGSDGADGSDLVGASGGGAGSGGGLLLGALHGIVVKGGGRIEARGGKGGKGSSGGNSGGAGGDGRIRIDSKGGAAAVAISPTPKYIGPAIDRGGGFQSYEGTVVTGIGLPGRKIRVYVRPLNGVWLYDRPLETTVAGDSTWSVPLGREAGVGRVYLAAMQQFASPQANGFTAEPEWVLSPMSASTIGRSDSRIESDTLDFGCVRFDTCVVREIVIENVGEFSDLVIKRTGVSGDTVFKVVSAGSPIVAGAKGNVRVRFCPADTGTFQATLLITTNERPDSVRVITLRGCGSTGQLGVRSTDVVMGTVCIGDCRDTTIKFFNVGDASVTITEVRTDSTEMISDVRTRLPLTMKPGDSALLDIRLCFRSIDDNGAGLYIRHTAIDSLYSQVRILAVNGGPDPGLFSELDFGNIDLSGMDSCREHSLVITNRSAISNLTLTSIGTVLQRFKVIDPPAPGTVIPPGEKLVISLLFCADTLGVFEENLKVSFGNGFCAFDTIVKLRGRAERKRPILAVVYPFSRTMRFPNTLVGTQTRYDTIEIQNSGDAPGVIQLPVVAYLGDTGADELLVDLSQGYDHPIAPSAILRIPVVFSPARKGDREAVIYLRGSEGWFDTLLITGKGVQSGVQLNRTTIDFGNVRVGGSSPPESIVLENLGTAPDTIRDIRRRGDTSQIRQSTPPFPVELVPGGGVKFVLNYLFKPDAERSFSGTAVVSFAADVEIELKGRGVLEHIAADRSFIDFGCLYADSAVDSANAFTLSNTGEYPLIVSELTMAARSNAFKVVGADLPDTIPPGGSVSYSVRYTAARGAIVDTIVVRSSAREPVRIALFGDLCRDDRSLTLRPANSSGTVGEYVEIPILANLDIPTQRDVEYTVMLEYAYDLLAPLINGRTDARPPIVAGMLSSQATMELMAPGKLKIQGKIAANSGRDTLVAIPMKVLLGSTYRSSLLLKGPEFKLPGLVVTTVPGLFQAFDCDTLGGVTFLGNYALRQNEPNPFNPGTVIRYEIARRERVRLVLYDAMGTRVQTLLDEEQAPGEHSFALDARALPTGVYTYELIAGPFRKTMRMVLIE